MRRALVPIAIALTLLGAPAQAASSQERIVAELREQGFREIEVRRTLLGRVRIVATSRTYEREIVLNPATGVILRDFWTAVDAGGRGGSQRPSEGSDGDDRSGSSGSGGDDDADDDDDDDDGDDDGGDDDDD